MIDARGVSGGDGVPMKKKMKKTVLLCLFAFLSRRVREREEEKA